MQTPDASGTRQSRRALVVTAAVIGLALSNSPSHAQAGAPPAPNATHAPRQVEREPVRNIVLVHGAFADGSSWAKVITILQAEGFNVMAVQIPLTSLADDVATTRRALAQQTGPAILVGHSWGGVVITEAGTETGVAGLVYVAAFAPDIGEVVGDLGKPYPPPPALAAPIADEAGFLRLSLDAVVRHFASDLPEKEARVVAATQRPIAASAFGSTVSGVAWKTKPSWYIVSKLDGAIAPDLERFFAKRMQATTTELNASHVPMLSQPQEVAAVIMEAATNSERPQQPYD